MRRDDSHLIFQTGSQQGRNNQSLLQRSADAPPICLSKCFQMAGGALIAAIFDCGNL